MNKLKIILTGVVLAVILQTGLIAQDVPFVPTSPEVVQAMLELAEVTKNDIVYDLGCGDGRIVVAAARDFGARGFGVDSNPERIEESNKNAEQNNVKDKVNFKVQNLFEADISEATVVALYLLNSVNYKLRPKLFQDLKPGTRIVSHAFTMEDWTPDAHREVDNRDVYLWIIPENVSGIWNSNNISFNIEQEFQNVSGTITVDNRKYNIRDAQLQGNKINFTALVEEKELYFDGEISKDQLTGKLNSLDNTVNEEVSAIRENGTMKPLDPQLTSEVK